MANKKRSRGRPALQPRIAENLRVRVAAMKPGEPFGTEVAIAAECGVTRMTVRKAVDELVAEGLVERRAGVGLFVCGKGGAASEPVARLWRFVAGNLLWDSALRTARAFRVAAAKSGVEVELRDAGGDMKALVAEIAALPESGAAGAAVFSQHGAEFDEAIRAVAAKGYPVVVVDEKLGPCCPATCILSDNALGGRLVAERIVREGHRKSAFVGDFVADTVCARWEGFAGLVTALGGEKPAKYDIKGEDRLGDWATEVHAAVRRILKGKDRPTVLFCSCDAIARHAMRALAEEGVSVPCDMSLVGFDDDPIAEWTSPALTTIRQDFSAMGAGAARALAARIKDPSAPGRTLLASVSIVVRESLARRANGTEKISANA